MQGVSVQYFRVVEDKKVQTDQTLEALINQTENITDVVSGFQYLGCLNRRLARKWQIE